jgi:hypothetical protein
MGIGNSENPKINAKMLAMSTTVPTMAVITAFNALRQMAGLLKASESLFMAINSTI